MANWFTENPRVDRDARRLSTAIAIRHAARGARRSGPRPRVPATHERAATHLRRGVWSYPPSPELLSGAGIVATKQGDYPVVFVDERFAGAKISPEASIAKRTTALSEIPVAAKELASLLGERAPEDTRAMVVPPPTPQFGPGRTVLALAKQGTLGALVTTEDGVDAILTAGHVGLDGTQVNNSGGATGKIIFSTDPAQVSGAGPVADVAVIVPDDPGSFTTGIPLGALGQGTALAEITAHGAVTATNESRIAGLAHYMLVPGAAGQWGTVYLTDGAFSEGGDSGGPVVLRGTDHVIGHIVGASGTLITWFQDIHYQLEVSKTTFRPSP